MIGMNFEPFLVLLVTAVVAAAVVHYGLGYRFLEGIDGFLGKVIAGWVGAWIGTPVLGHWFEALKAYDVYLLPALLGAFAASFLIAATAKTMAKIITPRIVTGVEDYTARKVA